jgi:hypothetical protein
MEEGEAEAAGRDDGNPSTYASQSAAQDFPTTHHLQQPELEQPTSTTTTTAAAAAMSLAAYRHLLRAARIAFQGT